VESWQISSVSCDSSIAILVCKSALVIILLYARPRLKLTGQDWLSACGPAPAILVALIDLYVMEFIIQPLEKHDIMNSVTGMLGCRER
jgi:hypothetical protein